MPNPEPSSLTPISPGSHDLLRGRSWEWLLDLRRRLNVGVQIVDPALGTVLPRVDNGVAIALGHALETMPPPLRTALTAAIQSRTPHAVVLDTLHLHCFPLAVDRAVVGVLVAAREGLSGADTERTRGELELIGSTLSSAATAHLAGGSTVGASGDLERVSALARLLSELLTEQSDREAMTAFAEALAVWHDVELRGYVEAAGDDYRLDVAPPGAAESTAPLRLSLDGLLEDRGVAVLSGADAHRLGFEVLGDTVTARVGVGRGSWLLFLSGQIDPLTVARLDVYVRMLAQWMVAKLADGRARLTTAMASAFLSSTATLDRVARQALELLEREVGSGALVSVTTATGAPLVRAGGAGSSLDRSAGEPLVLIRRSADAPVVTLAVTEPDGRPLTAVQCAAAQSAAELFETWSRAVESRAGVGERRASSRPPDEVFERMAAQAAERGVGVSALVLSSPLLVFRPEHAQVWLARARALMRTSDVIGMLGESEVGVLLHDATGEQAGIVARRLTRAVEKDEPSLGGSLRIGMATRLAGAAAVPGLVQEARRGMGGHGHQWPQREGGTRQ